MAWGDFFLHISPALRNEIRRSQIDGWLTGVDRHIALTSVKKLTRANRWLPPTVQLFPFAPPTVVRVKNPEVWKISIFVEAVTAVSCWCSTKETASKRPHFSLCPNKCGIHVSSNTSTVLWKGLRIATMSSRETRIAFCTTQSEKDKTTQISKIQNLHGTLYLPATWASAIFAKLFVHRSSARKRPCGVQKTLLEWIPEKGNIVFARGRSTMCSPLAF